VSQLGLRVTAGAGTVTGGMTITDGITVTNGNTIVSAGAMSITSSSTSTSALDVFASSTSFAGNVILGRVNSAPSGISTLLSLTEGNNALFQARLIVHLYGRSGFVMVIAVKHAMRFCR
jgi:hypothetical protein